MGRDRSFSSKIVHGHTKTVLLGNNMYIMTQAPEKGKKPCLPHGLSVANTYIEMTTGSRCGAIVNKEPNSCTNYYWQGCQGHQVVAANRVPHEEVIPGMLEKVGQNGGSLTN